MRVLAVLWVMCVLWGVMGCDGTVRCTVDSDCRGRGVCDLRYGFCVTSADSGDDAGPDGGDGGPDCPQGCAQWQSCQGGGGGVCRNVSIQVTRPANGAVYGGGASVRVVAEVREWDGGVYGGAWVPAWGSAGVAAPGRLEKDGGVFEGDFGLPRDGGRHRLGVGWTAVEAVVEVVTEVCRAACAEWEECVPTASGGRCDSLGLRMDWESPLEGQKYAVGAGVPLRVRGTRPDGGALPRRMPYRVTGGGGELTLSGGSWVGTETASSVGGVKELVAGWEDGGPTSSLRRYVVDVVAPVLEVRPASAPIYPGDAGDFWPNEPGQAAGWRRGEVIDVEVSSVDDDVDAGSVEVVARFGGDGEYRVPVATARACSGTTAPYCRVYRVDTSQVEMRRFSGEMEVRATGWDVYGNRTVVGGEGRVRVTRWQWARRVTPDAVRATPALADGGLVILGLADAAPPNGVMAIRADGTVAWGPTDDGAVVGSPAVGRDNAGVEYVFYQPAEALRPLKAVPVNSGAVLDRCNGQGNDAAEASPAVLGNGSFDVQGVCQQPANSESRIVGLRPAGHHCLSAESSPPYKNVPFPGNIIAAGNRLFWADSDAFVRSAVWTGALLADGGLSASIGGIGTTNGISMLPGGTRIAGGGGGAGVGRLFGVDVLDGGNAFPLAPAFGATPATAPVVLNHGVVVSGLRANSRLQLVGLDSDAGVEVWRSSELAGSSFNASQSPAPLAGSSGYLYAVDRRGGLFVMSSQLRPDAGALWTTSLPAAIAGAVSASPTLDCNRAQPQSGTGVLYLATESGWLVSYVVDSRGLDETAFWPKYQRDAWNTGNTATVGLGPACQ